MQLFELKGIVFRERERAQKENTMVSGGVGWGSLEEYKGRRRKVNRTRNLALGKVTSHCNTRREKSNLKFWLRPHHP